MDQKPANGIIPANASVPIIYSQKVKALPIDCNNMGNDCDTAYTAIHKKKMAADMADTALLASQRAVPARLLETGYAFRYPELPAALHHVLGRAR